MTEWVNFDVTAAGPGRYPLGNAGAREQQQLASEAAQAQALIGELTAKLRELSRETGNLQVTRKTLISLAGHGSQPAAEPAGQLQHCPITPPASRSLPPSPARVGPSGPATRAWP